MLIGAANPKLIPCK